VDTGKIILQSPTAIGAEETSGELYERLRELAAGAVLEALRKLETGDAGFRSQDPAKATPAPKVHPGTGKLDFRQRGQELCRAVRAFTPRPGAFFYLDGSRIKVLKAGFLRADNTRPGKIAILSKKQFAIHCKDGYFLPLRLQSPGRRPMDVSDWMNGADLAKLQDAWVEVEKRSELRDQS
jgi:methionyl-tRNA formyltransferase